MGKHVATGAHFLLSDHIWAAASRRDASEIIRAMGWEDCVDLAQLLTAAGFVHKADLTAGSELIEWGVEYDLSSSESINMAADGEEEARALVSESPTDHGLRFRRVSPWREPGGF